MIDIVHRADRIADRTLCMRPLVAGAAHGLLHVAQII